MKTSVVFKDMNQLSSKQTKKNVPSHMTEAFGDKENVVERSHATVNANEPTKSKVIENTSEVIKDKVKRVTVGENVSEKKKMADKVYCEEKNQITADDLTNPSGPSENYWKLMAEQRGKALKEVLDENKILVRKCELLEAETETLKQALQEATEVIEVLNQIVAEEEAESQTNEAESETESQERTDAKTSPVKEQSKSKVEGAFGNDSTVYDESDDSGPD